MLDIKFRDYQQPTYDEIIQNLNIRHLLVQAECGWGKSILIGKLANHLQNEGRVLILTHRVELLIQNHEWLDKAGVLSSKLNTVRYDSKIVIGMVETVNARIKTYGVNYLGSFTTILCDEAHLDYFKKVYDQLEHKRLIGFTATPMTNKRESKTIDGVEFTRPLSMANEYDKLICGVGAEKLIELGYLNQDYNIVLRLPDIDKLKTSDSAPDGFTKASINEVYNNTASLEVLYKAYDLYGRDKKTIIFNANSTINKSVYDYLVSKGVNCKLFDSVNTSDMNRDEIVEWFANTPDAVLINANIFLIGFNVPDLETILFNRATKSLALYLQAAGRGARVTDKIYKDKFTFVDLGQNILEHGTFSQKRNWQDYFQPADWKRKVAADLLSTWECTFCGALNITGIEECEICHMPKEDVVVESNGKKMKEGEFEELADMPLPKAKSIISYSIAQGKDSNFAFKLLEQKIVDLFIHYNVSKTFYQTRKTEFHIIIKQIYVPIYFAIIKSKEISGARKTIETQLDRLYKKIDKLYMI
jgi:superfamily II DNA or RNA helicase